MERAWVRSWDRQLASGSAQWQRIYTFRIYFRGWNGWLWWGTEYGGEKRTKDVSKTSSLSKQVLCYDLWGEGTHSHNSLTSHSAFYPFYLYLILYKGVKWIWHVWEGEGHNLGNQKALYQWLHWQNSMRLIPQRPGQSFCRGLRESISEITSPIEKTANESLQTLCILEEQRSFHWRVSLSCPSMFWSELYLMLWIKRKLPGKRKAKMGKG